MQDEYIIKMKKVADKTKSFDFDGVKGLRANIEKVKEELYKHAYKCESVYEIGDWIEESDGKWNRIGWSYEPGEDITQIFVRSVLKSGVYTVRFVVYSSGIVNDIKMVD